MGVRGQDLDEDRIWHRPGGCWKPWPVAMLRLDGHMTKTSTTTANTARMAEIMEGMENGLAQPAPGNLSRTSIYTYISYTI